MIRHQHYAGNQLVHTEEVSQLQEAVHCKTWEFLSKSKERCAANRVKRSATPLPQTFAARGMPA
jgi:hypothetical protein